MQFRKLIHLLLKSKQYIVRVLPLSKRPIKTDPLSLSLPKMRRILMFKNNKNSNKPDNFYAEKHAFSGNKKQTKIPSDLDFIRPSSLTLSVLSSSKGECFRNSHRIFLNRFLDKKPLSTFGNYLSHSAIRFESTCCRTPCDVMRCHAMERKSKYDLERYMKCQEDQWLKAESFCHNPVYPYRTDRTPMGWPVETCYPYLECIYAKKLARKAFVQGPEFLPTADNKLELMPLILMFEATMAAKSNRVKKWRTETVKMRDSRKYK